MIWNYLRAHNLKKVGIIKLEHPYINNLITALTKSKKADESVTVIDAYQSFGDKDFRTSITKVKNSGSSYDILGVFLGSGQIGQFYNQAGTLGLKMPTLGTDFFESQSDIDAAGKNIDGAVYANYEVSSNFRNEYQSKFGNVSQISYAGNGYDIAMALAKMNLSTKDSILSGFKGLKNYNGVLGSYNYIESAGDRYVFSPVYMKVIQGGTIKVLN